MNLRCLTAAICFLAGNALAEDATMIVLDASGSMWGQIDGVNKITIAQDVVRETLTSQAVDRPLGLIAYGHNRKGDCTDIEVLVPLAKGTAPDVAAATAAINPRGKTPLTEAVRRAAGHLNHTETAATVVLITDGLETCNADPCALARALEREGVQFTAHVVGFGLSQKDGAKVACLAEETGGKYLPASSASELAAALTLTVAQDPADVPEPPAPAKERPKNNLQINVQITADSPPLAEGEIQRLDLRLIARGSGAEKRLGVQPSLALNAEPGDYTLRALYEGGTAEMDIQIDAFEVTHATLVLNAGRVSFRAVPQGQPFDLPRDLVSWKVIDLDSTKNLSLFSPAYDAVLGAGRYSIQAVIGRKEEMSPPAQEIEVPVGGLVSGEVEIRNTRLVLLPAPESGAPARDDAIRYGLWTVAEDGTPGKLLVGRTGGERNALFALPGDYMLVVEDWSGSKRKLVQALTIPPSSMLTFRVLMPDDATKPLQLVPQ